MRKDDYLIEIGLEELPPKAMLPLINAFESHFTNELEKAQLAFEKVTAYAAPRRLALKVSQLAGEQPEQNIEKRGPAVQAAFDADGNPTKAAAGFARSCGVDDPSTLDRLKTDKGEWLVFRDQRPGESIESLVPGMVERSLDAMPVERAMRWGSTKKAFVRPVHWIVSLYGNDVLDLKLYDMQAGRESQGHRFMSEGPVTFAHPNEYEEALEKASVIAAFARRRDQIAKQLDDVATAEKAEVVVDPDLLDEVTALVDWPVALCGRFDEEFLKVPEEALISAMKSHQRYFHLVDDNGRLLPRFVTIANIASSQPETVIAGNERVITPRLTDAAFFFRQDAKTSLEEKTERLKQVVFQSKLGTYFEKAERVSRLAGQIEALMGVDVGAARAGMLCKADLMTDMVDEFPDLQGIMGTYYARGDGEAESICVAIGEHYRPTQSGGDIPASVGGQIVAIADKLDTITGIFGIGQPPTGSRDPFALRRQSLGVLRILTEAGIEIDLFDLIDRANDNHDKGFDASPLKEYMIERLAVFYQDRGIQVDTFEAARNAGISVWSMPDFDRRIRAIEAFRSAPEVGSLAAANKRVANLLKQADASSLPAVNNSLFSADVEGRLVDAIGEKDAAISSMDSYAEMLTALAGLQAVVDEYFDDVLVMDEDETVRNNRLATLASMRALFLRVADVSMLQV